MIDSLQNAVPCLVLVGLLWGCTNPLMKMGSKGMSDVVGNSKLSTALLQIYYLCTNWKYIIPLVLNQVGSVIYFFTLRSHSISLCVPLANSLTLIFTVLMSSILGERKLNKRVIAGISCVVIGIGCHLTDELNVHKSKMLS